MKLPSFYTIFLVIFLRLLTCNGFHFPTLGNCSAALGSERESQKRLLKLNIQVCTSSKKSSQHGAEPDPPFLWRWLGTLSSLWGRTKRSEEAAAGSGAGWRPTRTGRGLRSPSSQTRWYLKSFQSSGGRRRQLTYHVSSCLGGKITLCPEEKLHKAKRNELSDLSWGLKPRETSCLNQCVRTEKCIMYSCHQ